MLIIFDVVNKVNDNLSTLVINEIELLIVVNEIDESELLTFVINEIDSDKLSIIIATIIKSIKINLNEFLKIRFFDLIIK